MVTPTGRGRCNPRPWCPGCAPVVPRLKNGDEVPTVRLRPYCPCKKMCIPLWGKRKKKYLPENGALSVGRSTLGVVHFFLPGVGLWVQKKGGTGADGPSRHVCSRLGGGHLRGQTGAVPRQAV